MNSRCRVLTISPVAGFLQHALLGLLDDQGFEPRIIYERTTARWIAVLKQKRGITYQTTSFHSSGHEASERIRKTPTEASSEVVSGRVNSTFAPKPSHISELRISNFHFKFLHLQSEVKEIINTIILVCLSGNCPMTVVAVQIL